MSETDELLRKGIAGLKALGKEIDQVVKGASEEAKEQWTKLEPKVRAAGTVVTEKGGEVGSEVDVATKDIVDDLTQKLVDFRSKL